MTGKRSTLVKAVLACTVIFCLVYAWYRWDMAAFFAPARIEALLESIGPLAPLIYMAVMAVTAVFVPIPGPPLFVIAGPCVIESEAHTRMMAERIAKIAADVGVPYIFKASYDKANRSSVNSYRGPGLAEGLRILHDFRP